MAELLRFFEKSDCRYVVCEHPSLSDPHRPLGSHLKLASRLSRHANSRFSGKPRETVLVYHIDGFSSDSSCIFVSSITRQHCPLASAEKQNGGMQARVSVGSAKVVPLFCGSKGTSLNRSGTVFAA